MYTTIPTAAGLLALILLAASTACTTISPRDKPGMFEDVRTQNRPVLPPTRSVSGFTDSLHCMDRMLRDYRIPKTMVSSKFIADPTTKINVATQEMVITALSTMSRVSGTFRYVDYEVETINKQDTIQNLTKLANDAGQMQLKIPQIYVSGALSYMDQNVVVQRMGMGMSARNWETGYSKDYFGSAFGLELHLGDFNTRTLLPGMDSSNEIIVANAARGVDLGGRIRKTGVQFNLGQEVSQGTGPAVRTLVELGMVELVGKWARVPYWQCLALDQTHPEFQYQLREWWQSMSADERMKLFQTGLRSQQYFQGSVDGLASAALKDAVMRYQADRQVVVTGNLTYETYEQLVRDYVVFDGAGNFVRIGWGAPKKSVAPAHGGAAKVEPSAQQIALMTPRNQQSAIGATTQRAVKVQLSVNSRDGQFSVGDKLIASVALDRQAWLYCYYQDSRGNVSQIYPNPQQRQQPVHANLAITVPDADQSNSFSLELNRPGQEALACLATERNPGKHLPAALRGPALSNLPTMLSVSDVDKAFEAALGSAAVGGAGVRYVVVAK
jgi:Domain of unknown function (DUF4384)/Putative peptidoglycan binding domain